MIRLFGEPVPFEVIGGSGKNGHRPTTTEPENAFEDNAPSPIPLTAASESAQEAKSHTAVAAQAVAVKQATMNPAAIGIRPTRIRSISPLLQPDLEHYSSAEQYRIARTKLTQALGRPFRIVITSSGIGDGKTISAMNLASALAMKADGQTLLIDADLRRSKVHDWLGVRREPGLAEVLAGRIRVEDAIFRTEEQERLYVLPAGHPAEAPPELLDASRWPPLAEWLSRFFTYIVVDSPPVDLVADYDLIAPGVDGVVVVVRPDQTQRPQCFSALKKVRQKLTGVLINEYKEWFFSKPPNRHYYYYSSQQEKSR
jgi:capsular exopolysaccharide synthesis family protein